MSLLKTLVKEMAAAGASGADAIANVPGSLLGGGAVDIEKSKQKRRKMFRRVMNMKESLGVDQDRTEFDAADVISKIDAAGKKADQDDDTTPFGLEDEDGNMIKVYIKNDQSEEFEKTLAAMLAGVDEDDDGKNAAPEIAEVLFKLKDKFEIVNVEWPGIEGDKEEEAEDNVGSDPLAPGGDDPLSSGSEGGEDPLEAGDDDTLAEPSAGGEGEMIPAEGGAESALNQVIDMMKSDAEAKKAEADARAEEARAKQAEYTALAGAGRVRKEEQVYDMEQAKTRKKEEEQEAKQQAELARYQYQKAQDSEVRLSMESILDPAKDDENEKTAITLEELSELIIRNLRHQ